MAGKLYLIPAPISENTFQEVIPSNNLKIINSISYFIVENERTSRRYLIDLKIEKKIDDLTFFTLNKHTKYEDLVTFLDPIKNGYDIGLLSEAGLPCVADPGSKIVELAHQANIIVRPLIGPSSIFLALMASGLNGQCFAFQGYLPINKQEKAKAIKQLEKKSKTDNQSQIFIETPFRNNQILDEITQVCNKNTKLCIAMNVTSKEEFIYTKTIQEWAKNKPNLNKKPAIFIIHAS